MMKHAELSTKLLIEVIDRESFALTWNNRKRTYSKRAQDLLACMHETLGGDFKQISSIALSLSSDSVTANRIAQTVAQTLVWQLGAELEFTPNKSNL